MSKYIIATITAKGKTKNFDFKANKEYKIDKAIFASPGFSWNQKEGFIEDKSNKGYLLISTFLQAQEDSMFCSIEIPGNEHENLKKLYYLILQK